MVISKEEALAAAVERDKQAYEEFCAKIDKQIEQEAGTGQAIFVPISGVPQHLVDRAFAAYTSAGWSCKVTADQREGRNIVFD